MYLCEGESISARDSMCYRLYIRTGHFKEQKITPGREEKRRGDNFKIATNTRVSVFAGGVEYQTIKKGAIAQGFLK